MVKPLIVIRQQTIQSYSENQDYRLITHKH
jgi:hypothetical protein